jgi:hypothetical protein
MALQSSDQLLHRITGHLVGIYQRVVSVGDPALNGGKLVADPKEKRATTHEGLHITNEFLGGRQTLYELIEQLPFPSRPLEKRARDRRGPGKAPGATSTSTNR